MAAKRTSAVSVNLNRIISERIAKNSRNIKKLASADSVSQRFKELLPLSNQLSGMFADNKPVLS